MRHRPSAGPQTGKAPFRINDNFIWDLEVNVVQVLVQPAAAAQVFTPGQVKKVTNFTNRRGQELAQIASFGPGMAWKADVTLNGPTNVKGANRGVDKLSVSFVQNLTASTYQGTYSNGVIANSELATNGRNTFWDTANAHSGAFYSDQAAAFFEGATANKNTKTIFEDDSPYGAPPINFKRGNITETLNNIGIDWNFNLFVAATSKDPAAKYVVPGETAKNDVYVGQALAKWRFNGTGKFINNTWTSNGAGVTGTSGWSALNAQSDSPKVDGSRFNDVVNQALWV